jgi:hypothetical protein
MSPARVLRDIIPENLPVKVGRMRLAIGSRKHVPSQII